jgi:deoxycytidine triphosphate deaminase
MAVYSDRTIRSKLHDLIIGGDANSATHCSYEFTASAVFKRSTSEEHKPVARLPVDGVGVAIEPAELVWVIAKERVTIPNNMVGLWIQTQTLSRKGLLLLNTTLIEPGYSGRIRVVRCAKARTSIRKVDY